MSLLSLRTPSEVAYELRQTVRRLRRTVAGNQPIPILVVEGDTDSRLLGRLALAKREQVFAAGDRTMVEGLLVHLRTDHVDDCRCAFLTDCDGRGKAPHLKLELDLVVTEHCDLEADLVELGVIDNVVADIAGELVDPGPVISQARDLGVMLSRIRRAAHANMVSFKVGGRRYSPLQAEREQIRSWRAGPVSIQDMAAVVSLELSWSGEQRALVAGAIGEVGTDFQEVCSGKDVIDFAIALLRLDGVVVTPTDFATRVEATVSAADLEAWEVRRRLLAWQQRTGLPLFT